MWCHTKSFGRKWNDSHLTSAQTPRNQIKTAKLCTNVFLGVTFHDFCRRKLHAYFTIQIESCTCSPHRNSLLNLNFVCISVWDSQPSRLPSANMNTCVLLLDNCELIRQFLWTSSKWFVLEGTVGANPSSSAKDENKFRFLERCPRTTEYRCDKTLSTLCPTPTVRMLDSPALSQGEAGAGGGAKCRWGQHRMPKSFFLLLKRLDLGLNGHQWQQNAANGCSGWQGSQTELWAKTQDSQGLFQANKSQLPEQLSFVLWSRFILCVCPSKQTHIYIVLYWKLEGQYRCLDLDLDLFLNCCAKKNMNLGEGDLIWTWEPCLGWCTAQPKSCFCRSRYIDLYTFISLSDVAPSSWCKLKESCHLLVELDLDLDSRSWSFLLLQTWKIWRQFTICIDLDLDSI